MDRIHERYYLSYPRTLIREPILYQLVKKFDLIFNIRGASVSEDMGLVAVEFEGTTDQIERASNGFGKLASQSSRSKKTSSSDMIAKRRRDEVQSDHNRLGTWAEFLASGACVSRSRQWWA